MKRIKRLLPDEYYLDKNYFPLAEKIAVEIINSPYYNEIHDEIIRDIVGDVLTAIKPRAKTNSNGETILY